MRSRGGQVTERREIEIAPGLQAPLLSPLMRIFAGPSSPACWKMAAQGAVIVPDIRDPRRRRRCCCRFSVNARQAHGRRFRAAG